MIPPNDSKYVNIRTVTSTKLLYGFRMCADTEFSAGQAFRGGQKDCPALFRDLGFHDYRIHEPLRGFERAIPQYANDVV